MDTQLVAIFPHEHSHGRSYEQVRYEVGELKQRGLCFGQVEKRQDYGMEKVNESVKRPDSNGCQVDGALTVRIQDVKKTVG
jgi:hypothetical protein